MSDYDSRWRNDQGWNRDRDSDRGERDRWRGEGRDDYGQRSRDQMSSGFGRQPGYGYEGRGREGYDYGREFWRQQERRGAFDQSQRQRSYGSSDYGNRDGSMRGSMGRDAGDRDYGGRGPGNRGYGGDRSGDYGTGYDARGDYGQDFGGSDYRSRGYGGYGGFGRSESRGPDYRGSDYRGSDYRNSDYRGSDYRGSDYGRDSRTHGDQDRGFFERAGDEMASWFGDEDAERRRRRDAESGDSGAQHHRGRGPRGYTRSDDRIREDVSDRLTDDPYLDATNLDVSVSNGEVTLSGTVDDRRAKRRAEDVAESISGVTHVQNNLRLSQSSYGGAGTSAGASAMAGLGGTGGLGTNVMGSGGISGTAGSTGSTTASTTRMGTTTR